jgi:polysaccharide biosynthesis transport protein
MESILTPDGSRQRVIPASRNNNFVPDMSLQPVADSIGLNQLMTALWDRKVVIGLAMILGVSVGIVAGLLKKPVYRARTSLQLQGFNENFLREANSTSPVVGTGTAETYLQDQVKILQSEAVARRVADQVGIVAPPLKKLGWMSSTLLPARRRPTPEELRINFVKKSLSVRTSLQSQVLEVFYDSADPELAAKAANATATQYIALNREARWQLAQDTTDWLNRETAALKKRLEKSGQDLEEYARSSGLVFSGAQNGLSEDRLRQVQDALSRAEAERAARQSRYETALAGSAEETLPDATNSGPIRDYQVTLGGMRRQLAEFKTMYTPAYEKVKRLEAQIAETEAAIGKERQKSLNTMRGDFASAVALERMLTRMYGSETKKVQDQTEKYNRYGILRREFDTTQQIYSSLLQKEKETAAASALSATNIRLIDVATPPSSPYSPNFPLNSALGLVFGAVFGLGSVFIGEHSDKLRRPGDSSLFNLPELGVIPSVKPSQLHQPRGPNHFHERKATALGTATWNQETSFLSESFRGVLASILFSADRSLKVLVVTSANPQEGKTSVLSNLGIALAETKQRVILIDADLRRPNLHKVFDVCNDWGLTDLLQRSESIDLIAAQGLARPTRIPELFVLPAGPGTATIPSLFYSNEMKHLLRRLRKEFDFILIDSPPVLPFCDARVLGQVSDGVVLVVRPSKTGREQLRNVCLRLMQDCTPVLGTILNDLKIEATAEAKNYYEARKSI